MTPTPFDTSNSSVVLPDLSLVYGRLALTASKLVPMSDRIRPPFNSSGNTPNLPLSNGTNLGGSFRERVVAQYTGHAIVLDFSDWYNNGPETNGTDPFTIKASVELTATFNMPLTFNGQLSTVIDPNSTVVRCDPLGVRFKKGDIFWVRGFITVTAGQKYPLMRTTRGNTYGEGENFDPALAGPGADVTPYGSAWAANVNGTNFVRTPGPSGIYATPEVFTSSILAIGDSRVSGTGEDICYGSSAGVDQWIDHGWLNRACYLKWPHVVVGFSGTTLASWTANTGLGSFRRRSFIERMYFTHILCDLGINDINGGSSLTATQALWLAVWTDLTTHGRPVYQTTLAPFTTSTDNWTTISGQTPFAFESVRVQSNDWLRDGAPILNGVAVATGTTTTGTVRAGQIGHPLTGIVEIADLVESARDSGKWGVLPVSRIVSDSAITTGTAILTSATANFTANDVGLHVVVVGAGVAGGLLVRYITVVTNATTVTLSGNASTTVAGAVTQIGANGFTADGIHPSGNYGNNLGGHGTIASGVTPALTVILGPQTS